MPKHEQQRSNKEQSIQEKRTFCRVCEPACGMIAEVDGTQLIRLRADKDHPVSKGYVCNKGIYGADIHNDPDRLKYPLKRIAPGQFERIGWAQALTEISERLKAIITTHGPKALSAYTGNPTAFNSLYGPSFSSFVTQLGVRKLFSSGTQDCANKFAGSEAVFGTRTLHPLPDFDHSDFILLIGENPAVSHMSFVSMPNPMQRLKDAHARGARVVYLNPRRIESATIAGEVQFIKPDTDVYLLAAMIAEIDRGPGFAEDAWQRGRNLEELRLFVHAWPAERVESITGIPAADIRRLANDFSRARAACVHMSTGGNMGRQGTLAYWLVHMLALVTGNLGKRGGNIYSLGFYSRSPSAGAKGSKEMVDTPFGRMRKQGASLPGNLMADYLENPHEPIRALFVNSGNPVLSIAGEERMRAALASLELLVCVDIYRNATSEYAHYILPAAGAFEREDINITGIGLQDQPSVQYTGAVVPPGFERKPDWWIYESLSRSMGFRSSLEQTETPDMWARVDAMLRSRGHNMSELKEKGVIVFERSEPEDLFAKHIQTDDQRVDCFPEFFAEPIERMHGIFDELAAEPEHQLKLITKRDAYMINSWYSNLPKLKTKDRDRNYLFMHPQDAALRQIQDGATVRIANRFGTIQAPVKLTDDLMPGVVAMTHGWGQSKTPGMTFANKTAGVNCNVLLPSGPGSFEPISSQAHMTGINVEVAPSQS